MRKMKTNHYLCDIIAPTNMEENGYTVDIQTDKQVVDAHRKEWRCTRLCPYRYVEKRGGSVYRPASGMDR